MESLWGKQKLYVQRKSCLLIFHIRKSWSSDILSLTAGRGLSPSRGTHVHPLQLVSCQIVRWRPIICQHSPLIMSYSSPSRTSGVCLVAFSRISCKKDKLDVYVLVLFKIFGSDRSPRRGDLVRAYVHVCGTFLKRALQMSF